MTNENETASDLSHRSQIILRNVVMTLAEADKTKKMTLHVAS